MFIKIIIVDNFFFIIFLFCSLKDHNAMLRLSLRTQEKHGIAMYMLLLIAQSFDRVKGLGEAELTRYRNDWQAKVKFQKCWFLRLVRDWIWKWTCLLLFITFKRSNCMTVISNELQFKFKSDEIEVYSFHMNYNDIIRYKVVISSHLEVMCCLNLV